MNPLQGKTVLLGVSGSIACYKTLDLASKLTQQGVTVQAVLTESAQKFVTALAFENVTGQPAYTNMWQAQQHVQHVQHGKKADFFLIAPATANTLAKLATGIADNPLALMALTAQCPVAVAPAMDADMYSHPAVVRNVATLEGDGIHIWQPDAGRMASGLVGVGRMQEPAVLLSRLRLALSGKQLEGKHIVVTAGGTQEPLDPVRFLTNRSSGKQGFAIAQAALDMGAKVTLLVAATARALPVPFGVECLEVDTAQQLHQAVVDVLPSADALIMAAAVADFKPLSTSDHKIKKQANNPLTLELSPNPDILQAVAASPHRPKVVVGFAAESQNVLEYAQSKLERKRLDMLVANDITLEGAGFAVDTNHVAILRPHAPAQSYPQMSKYQVGEVLLTEVAALLNVERLQ